MNFDPLQSGNEKLKKPVRTGHALPPPVLFLIGAASTSRCRVMQQQPFPASLGVR